MSFLQKLKRKRGSEDKEKPLALSSSPQPPPVPQEVKPKAEMECPPEPQGPTHPVEMESSIFSGLHLSSVVRQKEGNESPYLQKRSAEREHTPTSETPEEGASAFAFLSATGGSEGTDPPGLEEESSSFSFIKAAPETDRENTVSVSGPDRGNSPFSFIADSSGTQSLGDLSSTAEGEREDGGEEEEGSNGTARGGASPFSFLHQITSGLTTFDPNHQGGTSEINGGTLDLTRTHSETLTATSSNEDVGLRHASTALKPPSSTPTPSTEQTLSAKVRTEPRPTPSTDISDLATPSQPQAAPGRGSPGLPSLLSSPPPTALVLSPSPPLSGSGRAVAPGPVISTSKLDKPSPKKPVRKQLPPSGSGVKKKKKRTAFRPGQEGADILLSAPPGEGLGSRDPDSLSISSQSSSVEGGGKDSVSIGSSSSELHKLVPDDLLHVDETEAGSARSVVSRSVPSLPLEPSPVTRTGEKTSSRDLEEPTRSPTKREGLPPPGLSPRKGLAVSGRSKVEATGELVDISTEKKKPMPQVRKTPVARVGGVGGGEGGGGKGERTEEPKTSPDRELLAEVFTEPANTGERLKEIGRKEKMEGEKATGKQGANYKVELTSNDRLTALLQSSDSSLGSVRTSLADLQWKQKKAFEEHLASVRQQIERRSHMKELKVREAKALSEEDYELAEELSREMESISLEQERERTITTDSQSTLREWIKNCSEFMETEISLQQNMHRQLQELKVEQTHELAELDRELSSFLAKENMKLKTMEDKIERERGHVALDKDHLVKREQLLQEEVDQRSVEFVTNKNRLEEEHESVQSEIAALEAKLAELRGQASRIQASIQSEEAKISAVHEELSGEDGELLEERRELERQEEQLQKEVDGLEEARRDFQKRREEQEAKKLRVTAVIQTMSTRLEECGGRTDTLRQCTRHVDTLVAVDSGGILKPSEQLQSLQESCRAKDNEMKEATSQVLSLQAEISSRRKKMSDSEAQISQLEEAKKAAVAARQYKEAARVAAEIKVVNSSLDSEREGIKEAESRLATMNKQLSSIGQELAETKEELGGMEREEDSEQIRSLVNSVAVLKVKSASLPGTGTPLHEVLHYWSNLQQLLAEDLCAKHDLDLSEFKPEDNLIEEDTELEVEPESESDTIQRVDKLPPEEERTPGVGMELTPSPSEEPSTENGGGAKEGEEGDRRGEGGEEDKAERPDASKLQELRERIAKIEAEIEEACEKEDYDLAHELDEQLKQLQSEVGEQHTD